MEDVKPVIREMAQLLVSASEEYLKLSEEMYKRDGFVSARQRAYSLALVLAQMSSSLLVISKRISEVEEELRPPLAVPLILGALGGACTLIAASESPDKLRDVPLPGAEQLEVLSRDDITHEWIRRSLALPAEQ